MIFTLLLLTCSANAADVFSAKTQDLKEFDSEVQKERTATIDLSELRSQILAEARALKPDSAESPSADVVKPIAVPESKPVVKPRPTAPKAPAEKEPRDVVEYSMRQIHRFNSILLRENFDTPDRPR